MKHVLLLSFLSMGLFTISSRPAYNQNSAISDHSTAAETISLGGQPEPENEKMLAPVFRSQDYCRVELKDFVFDVEFKLVSAKVYFSGTNFRTVETGYITSTSLKPIKKLMERCAPGTMVVFDEVKVIGPDKQVRTIQGTSYLLR